jgi:zinc transporter
LACTAILAGDGPVRCVEPEEAATYHGPGFLWFHVESLEEADLATLKTQHDIPDVAANALVATETRPRCDRIDSGALVNLRGLAETETDDSDRLVSIRMWVRDGKVNSVSRRPLAATSDVIEQMEAAKIHDPGDLVAAFARAISKQLDPQVAELGDTLDDCESALLPRNVYKLRSRIAHIRSEAIAFRRFVAPDRDALTTLAQLDFEWLAEEDRLHIREAADRFARMAEELEAVRERAALLHEQLTDLRGELMESRALLISVVALVFLPLTFITGLFGMNVPGIPLGDHPLAFWWITALCVVIAVLIALYFARIQWLKAGAEIDLLDGDGDDR